MTHYVDCQACGDEIEATCDRCYQELICPVCNIPLTFNGIIEIVNTLSDVESKNKLIGILESLHRWDKETLLEGLLGEGK